MVEKHSKRQLSTAELEIFAPQSFLGAVVYQAAAVGRCVGVIMSSEGLS